MAELYRVSGDRRYLDFVRQTLDEYNFCSRFQVDGNPRRDYTVLLRGGTYRLARTAVLTLEDSAAPGRTVTWEADCGYRKLCSRQQVTVARRVFPAIAVTKQN